MINSSAVLSHHRTYRSVYGGSIELMPTDTVPAFWKHKRTTQHSCATSEFHSYLTQAVFYLKLSAFIAFLCVLQSTKTSYRSVLPRQAS